MEKSDLEREFNREFTESKDNWKASCPFHDDSTPSFYVHKTEHVANCFGCGVCGYIDTLLSRYSGLEISEARKKLHIKVIEDRLLKKPKEREAPKVFPESWLAPFEKKIHKSILERGYEITLLRSIGTLYDPARKRQVFPHRNERGNLAGAVGRECGGGGPKWYFYWDYSRGTTLYRPWGRRHNKCILAEGVFDVLRFKQAGLDNEYDLAAPIGTKLGKGQYSQLKEYDEVVIALDNDENESGQNASTHVYHRLKKSSRVRFALLPAQKDPDELSNEEAVEVIENAVNYVQRNTLWRAEASSGISM